MQDFNNQIWLEKNNYSISYDSLIDPTADDLLLYSLETVDETVWLLSNENIVDNSNQVIFPLSQPELVDSIFRSDYDYYNSVIFLQSQSLLNYPAFQSYHHDPVNYSLSQTHLNDSTFQNYDNNEVVYPFSRLNSDNSTFQNVNYNEGLTEVSRECSSVSSKPRSSCGKISAKKTRSRSCKWYRRAHECLVSFLKRRIVDVKNLEKRNGGTKQKLWEDASDELRKKGHEFSSDQCCFKWKNIKRNFKIWKNTIHNKSDKKDKNKISIEEILENEEQKLSCKRKIMTDEEDRPKVYKFIRDSPKRRKTA
ncbi:unnamed protein product [Rhizophagus irregularis]|nr:unnamed protein product [Rhizophagus irregularis]CAB5362447.1 unnamed protein product [Rhizophagus irregularis]